MTNDVNNTNVIWIDEDYGITTNPNNIILVKRTTVQSGKNIGNIVISNVGYYATLVGLYQGYMKQQENISVGTQNDIQWVLTQLDDVSKKAIVAIVAFKCVNKDVGVV